MKNDKRVQAKSSVVGADSKRKGNARLIVAELDTKLGGSGGGGVGRAIGGVQKLQVPALSSRG